MARKRLKPALPLALIVATTESVKDAIKTLLAMNLGRLWSHAYGSGQVAARAEYFLSTLTL